MISNTAPIGDVQETAVAGAFTVACRPFCDHRGCFARLFDRNLLGSIHGDRAIFQVNHSLTRQVGALRGMHFQTAPHLEAKWVRCLKGRVFDVTVDLRRGSATFLRHVAVELSAEAANMIFIPEGCAHGFQVIQPDSELLYLHTAPYSREAEGGVRWDDPVLSIGWPLEPSDISERDRSHPLLTDDFEGLMV
jgi:dTDP-4-dehydrorhamnose 3,5-epimerase